MGSRSRQLVAIAVVTSILSILIGGFAIWNSYQSEISIVDRNMNLVASEVRDNPLDAVSVALLSIEQNNFDFTLAFVATTGEQTILREGLHTPITGKDVKVRHIPMQEGEQLILASSLMDINKSRDHNLWKLLIFIILANIAASVVTSLVSRSGLLAQERAQREKMQEFLGDAAHELRTPMTVVKGYAELLRAKKLEEDREIAAFDRLNSELKRMDFLISDLLMLAQLGEESKGELEEVNLSNLLNENLEDFRIISPNRPLESSIASDVRISGEEKYLARFIQNAFTNIRLHTPDGTRVKVDLIEAKGITLLIQDSGPGLPPDSYGEKIRGLKRFDKSRSRDAGGTGLGLSIMSAVIERHRGSLTLRQSALGGLAIEVHLPRT
jgi:signal transduction histidine kinase